VFIFVDGKMSTSLALSQGDSKVPVQQVLDVRPVCLFSDITHFTFLPKTNKISDGFLKMTETAWIVSVD
jgi:hypothetical protein